VSDGFIYNAISAEKAITVIDYIRLILRLSRVPVNTAWALLLAHQSDAGAGLHAGGSKINLSYQLIT
jgi:hypothetical protein